MIVESGAQNISTYFVLRDCTEHMPKTNVDVTTITTYYIKYREAISEGSSCVQLESPSSPFLSNGACHVAQGMYRIDWPNNAFSGEGNTVVELILVCSGVDTLFLEVLLTPHLMAEADLSDLQQEVINAQNDLDDTQADLNDVEEALILVQNILDQVKDDEEIIKASQLSEESTQNEILSRVPVIGSGSIAWNYTLTNSATGLPISDAEIWVTTDLEGRNVIASGRTNQNGRFDNPFMLDAGPIYVWRSKTGFTFNNPDTEVVSNE